ncbi:MAG: dUTP pyrophosphatase [Clostridia bacterium]|nr:dUTP pyrophosphatase [Clostridia bacterium]
MINVEDNKIYFAKTRPNAVIPTKKLEDAGYDAYACFDEDYFVIEPFETRAVPTGIACAFSNKYYVQVEERSSTGKIGMKKSAGVMDSGYRGEYLIMTLNTNSKPFVISKIKLEEMPDTFTVGDKTYSKDNIVYYPYTKAICQLVLHILPNLESEIVSYEDLLKIESERGVHGFGSSGK